MHIHRIRRRPSLWRRIKSLFEGKQPQKKFPWGQWFLILCAVGFGGTFAYGSFFLPSVDDAAQLQFAESTVIYDRKALDPTEDPNEHVLYVIHGDENREYIPLEEISPWMKKATIAIEDDQFYSHFGFDIGGIIKAVLNEFFGIGTARGGSTITQQLVKNSFLSRERTITRKFKELLLSMKVEWYYDKDEILELYLNKIPYGHNAHGIEAAAKTFFGKSARELTLGESVILASLPVAPTRFSPYGANKDLLMGFYEYDEETGEKEYKKGRKDLVLQRMLDLKMISFEEFKIAWAETKELEFKIYRTDIKAPHFVFYVREKLEEKYGKEFIKQGGLRIYTTLDPDLQEAAERIITEKSAHYPSTWDAKNAALAALNPDTGEILAFVGGKDYFDAANDGQVNILTARRQPGSSFKPYVYAAAFEKGYSPATVLFDVETDFGGNYQPQNFDGEFLGPVSARDALNRSLNIPAVKTAYLANPKNVLDLADRVGVKFEGDAEHHGVAIGIGVAEVEPLSHIAGFQVFARDGTYFPPVAILEVQDGEGKTLESFDSNRESKEGIGPEISALIRHILTDETTRPTTEGFDWNVLLQLPGLDNGSKTGTSNRTVENPEFNEEEPEDEEENPKNITVPGDSWTLGFTPHLVTGVWVGNNRGEPMKPGATGLAVAAPIWKRFMTEAHEILFKKGASKEKAYPEIELETRKVNKYSGKLATDLTPPKLAKEEVFASFAVPTDLDDSVEMVEIDKISGRQRTRFTPFYARTQKYILKLASIRPEMSNWQSPVEEWIEDHPRFMSSLGAIMDSEEEIEKDEEEKERGARRFGRRSTLTSTARLRNLPDDVHNAFTQKNVPQIEIMSPKNRGSLAPGEVEVTVSVAAKFGVKTVEFYFDDVLISEAYSAPWTGRFILPKSAKIGTSHVIRTVVVDKLLNINEDEIEINIEGDYEGPEIIFLGPKGNQKIPKNSVFQILTEVRDFESRVDRVEFWLDNQNLGEMTEAPFQKNVVADGKLGRHFLMIRAWDVYDNFSEKSIPISYERERLIFDTSPVIEKLTNYKNSIAVDMVFPEPNKVEWAELVAKKEGIVVYDQKFTVVGKSAQFHIPKAGKGKMRIQMMVKFVGDGTVFKSPVKEIEG